MPLSVERPMLAHQLANRQNPTQRAAVRHAAAWPDFAIMHGLPDPTRRHSTLEGARMQGNQVIAQILKAEGVEWLSCFPAQELDRRGVHGGHSAHHVPPGTGRREHGGRIQPHHQRQEGRRLHHADRAGRRERLQRRRPGVCRFRSHPAAARRPAGVAHGRASEFRVGAQLPRRHQVGRACSTRSSASPR